MGGIGRIGTGTGTEGLGILLIRKYAVAAQCHKHREIVPPA